MAENGDGGRKVSTTGGQGALVRAMNVLSVLIALGALFVLLRLWSRLGGADRADRPRGLRRDDARPADRGRRAVRRSMARQARIDRRRARDRLRRRDRPLAPTGRTPVTALGAARPAPQSPPTDRRSHVADPRVRPAGAAPLSPGGRGLAQDDAISPPSNQWADFQAARERFFAALRGQESAVVGASRRGRRARARDHQSRRSSMTRTPSAIMPSGSSGAAPSRKVRAANGSATASRSGHHVELHQHLAQLLHRPDAPREPAVGDEGDRLGPPLAGSPGRSRSSGSPGSRGCTRG